MAAGLTNQALVGRVTPCAPLPANRINISHQSGIGHAKALFQKIPLVRHDGAHGETRPTRRNGCHGINTILTGAVGHAFGFSTVTGCLVSA